MTVPANLAQGGQAAPRSLAQIVAQLGPQSAVAAQSVVDGSLAAGIKPSFATLTFKGKTWGIRHRGVTHQLLARDPNTGQVLGSIPSVDIVVLKSAVAIGKSYYIEKYQEGDFKQPDCWSTNGQVPDPAAPKRQSTTCRGCKWDAFGSRNMEDGRKGKACSDSKRLCVVPAADLKNEVYGGPMLLKLPPSAFAGLSEVEANLQQAGYHYFAVVMRLSFDHTVAFPKIVFTPIAVLNDHQMTEVVEIQKNEVIDRILSEELYEVSADPAQPEAQQEQPEPPAPTVQPVQPLPPAQPVAQALNPVAPQPVQQATQAAPTSAFVAQPMQDANDPGPPPAAFRTPQPNGSAGPVAQPVQEAVAETAEQKIARLEAALAEASKPKSRKRTPPVTPGGTATVVQPAAQGVQPLPGPALPLTGAQPIPPSGGELIVPNGADEDDGDVPADLASRVDALLSQT